MKTWLLRPHMWIGAIVVLTSCQKAPDPVVQVWSQSMTSAPPPVFSSEQFSQSDRALWVNGDIVRFSQQRLGPARIEGGSLQVIESAKGELKYGKARARPLPESQLVSTENLERLETEKGLFLERLRERSSRFRRNQLLAGPELVLYPRKNRLVPTYRLDLLNPSLSRVERYWMTPDFMMVQSEVVSLNFAAQAWVYTLENRKQTQPVLIPNLIAPVGFDHQSNVLQSRKLVVRSEANEVPLFPREIRIPALKASGESTPSPLRFPPEDPRFDQTQVYYYVDRAIELLEKDWGFKIPIAIQVETAVGYPEASNAAFTYHNQIRLGRGDGQTYGPLAHDPTIVIHEVAHIVIEVLAHLPTQGEGGSLNEGFADFIAASMLNTAKMAEGTYLKGPHKRNLEDRVLYSEKKGGLYHDSLIVSGTLWDIRKKVGPTLAQKLAIQTLVRLGPAQTLTEFPAALRMALESMVTEKQITNEQQQQIHAILKERQWPESD